LISQDIELAAWAKEIPEVAQAKNKSDAKKIVKRLKEQVERNDKIQEIRKAGEGKEIKSGSLEERLLYYDKCCLLGDFMEVEFPEKSFQIVLFDPPWGVNFDSVKTENLEHKTYNDDRKWMKKNFRLWMERIVSLMAEDSHLYLFFGMANYHFVTKQVGKFGLSVSPIPLIWHKEGSHRTRNPEISHGRSYEPILFARKGKKKLQAQGRPDVISIPTSSPSMKQGHPSAKHPGIYLELIRRSAFPGDRVLDPMAGSGMSGVAANNLSPEGIKFTLVEKEKMFRDLCIFNLTRGLNEICKQAKDEEKEERKEEENGNL
jgi:DNA modification methylase